MKLEEFGPVSKLFFVEPPAPEIKLPDTNLEIKVPTPTTPIVATEFVKPEVITPIGIIESNAPGKANWISKIKAKHIIWGILIGGAAGFVIWKIWPKKKEKKKENINLPAK